jgi:hypothetical protein
MKHPTCVAADAYKYLVVGLLWGITNPLLRQGEFIYRAACLSGAELQCLAVTEQKASDEPNTDEGALALLKRALTNWKVSRRVTLTSHTLSMFCCSSFYSSG